MKTIGLFEAKTKLSEICQAVARTGESFQVTRRGEPVVIISPWREPGARVSIWARRKAFERQHGPLRDDFELPARKVDESTWRDPLA